MRYDVTRLSAVLVADLSAVLVADHISTGYIGKYSRFLTNIKKRIS